LLFALVIQQKTQSLATAKIQLTEVAAVPVATPSGSPHYLPDSTDDLCELNSLTNFQEAQINL
jgi:hypothetical protein